MSLAGRDSPDAADRGERPVLVTGATGFVGRHVVRALRRAGRPVVAVTRDAPRTPETGVRFIAGDLLAKGGATDVVRAAGCRDLVHLAWQVPEGGAWDSPVHARWAQVSAELVGALAPSGGRAVCVGSCAEYVWSGEPLHEASPLVAPGPGYGAAKATAAERCLGIARDSGLGLAWARVFFTFGPGEAPRRLIPAVLRAVLRGRAAEITSGRQRRDFLYVEDVADALVAVLESAATGPVNVASGEGVPVRALAACAAGLAGDASLLRVGAIPDRPDEAGAVTGVVSRLADEVGFSPAVGLKAGLGRTVEWWRAQVAADARGPG